MTGWANRNRRTTQRAAGAVALALALAPATLAAQDGQFDLRARPTPTPEPTVVGPVDPENPGASRPRPRPATTAAPPQVVPSAPAPAATANPPAEAATDVAARPQSTATRPAPLPRGATSPLPAPDDRGQVFADTPPAAASAPATRAPRAYQPRNLDLVAERDGIGLWLALGALALLLGAGGWLAWSRHFRNRAVAPRVVEIERPRLVEPKPEPAPAPVAPVSPAEPHTGLHLTLEATRMSATLMNTTLAYRLAVTNRSSRVARDVRIEGDMIAAHASRPHEPLFGTFAAVLPELHRVPALAPGESVTLGGEVRLPLVSITPIRRGNAAFFVPLARLRARGLAPTGVTVEGGGTYLIGQEPGANRKLQPFRLDLGPRNYSRLGQHLLSAA
ncbi:MAG: hypothetical protein LC648_01390 [Novosphingobium sp.]|nr:hypothetical protein [Novosphingobium sp.]